MSIERHPNIHAVQFTVDICDVYLTQNRLPTIAELRLFYERSLRGLAAPGDIDFDVISLLFLRKCEAASRDQVIEIITYYVASVSHRLDEALGTSVTSSE